MISRYAVDSLDSVALTEGGVLGASGSGVTERPGRSDSQRREMDRYFDEHLAFIEGAFRSIANHTNGIASYYYRINPEITSAAKGFFCLKRGTPDFQRAELTDLASSDPEDTASVGWYYIPLKQGVPSWIEPYYRSTMDGWVVSYVVPVYKAGTFIGVIGMDIRFDTLVTQIQQFTNFNTGYFALTGESARVFYHPDYEMGTELDAYYPEPVRAAEEMHRESSSQKLIRYDKNGSKWQMTYSTLTNGMKLVAVVQESEINSTSHSLTRVFAITGVLILLFFAAFTMLAAKRVTNPLGRLTEAAKRLAAGEYDVELDYESKDEAGVLTSTFRFMRDRLQQHFDDLNQQLEERQRLQEALSAALSEAEEANKAKTSFLSSMSHEIRTPMNAIIGLDTLALRDETLSEQTRDYLRKIGRSARHLLGLINDILDMSRIESGRMVLRREEFSFSAMLEEINTMVTSQCGDKGLTYECRILGKVDDAYIGDDMKLKEVLINILSNAVKFTDAPGSVTLTVERTAVFEDQSTLRFCVEDTGIGMDKEYLPRIFEAFSQEDSSRTNKYGSTGLGMAIAKRIVEMMNGTIRVESEKGVGTTFFVTVTLKNCEPREEAAAGRIDPHAMHVLVVDDDEIAAEHARMVLDEVGIRADVCTGGAEALRMMEVQRTKQEPYNLVLMDWKMPEMSGVEATEKIRKLYNSETTVIILTAYQWDDIQEEAHRVGVDSFLAKPLFASNVMTEFERVARRNHVSLLEEGKRAELAGRRILLAEDMEINAEIMREILSIEKIETDHAENGRIAVEMFANSAVWTYAAILMDVRMPEMDGLEATAAIRALDREDAKRIPIIAMTANAFDEDVQRSMQAGMNAHLSKPVESDHLFQTLGRLIYEAEESH